jgi:hypothetical protein
MRSTITFPGLALLALSLPAAVRAADKEPAAPTFVREGVAFLKAHCYHCHGEKFTKADLDLTPYQDEKSLLKDRKVWLKVLRMVESGEMPQKPRPRPAPEELAVFTRLVNQVFEVADRNARPDPGRVTIRRLNRVEYDNTIRDLVGVDFQPAEDFPSDDVGHGFDNIGDVLSLSPVLLERYLAAAESIMKRAILTSDPPRPPLRHVSARFLEPALQGNTDGVKVRKLDANGILHSLYNLTLDGDYRIRIRAHGIPAGDEPPRVAFLADEKELSTVEIKAEEKKPEIYTSPVIPLKAGAHRMVVKFINEFKDPKAADPAKAARAVVVEFIELEGPLDTTPASHRRIMAHTPGQTKEQDSREILTRFASRAYRRPAMPEEIDRLLRLVDAAEKRGEKWEAAMQLALQAVLVSPKFLFRVELDSRPDSADAHPIDEYQLASRLSYFLWSTMPDQELFDLAAANKLAANLEPQVRRMLKDPKSSALIENFAMQWLQLRLLKALAPDHKMFPQFDESLRTAMLKETQLFFEAIMREDRSILELIDADYTFLNERLARHYGIVDTNGTRVGAKEKPKAPGEPIRGEKFVRVHLADGERGGLLTQAAILTVTSNPTRTSPVKRGRWVLEQLLGTPPPPPPPNVPELPVDEKAQLTGSLRQRMEQHRASISCANCHARMDPLGFAFENYDAIGSFRTRDGGFDIDPSGTLPDGQTFQGPAQLKTILKGKKEMFSRCLTEKMLIYAVGRGLEYYDRRTVNAIAQALERNEYRFSTLVVEIVKSEPFGLRRGKDQP